MNEYCIDLVPFIPGWQSCAAQLMGRHRVGAPWKNPWSKQIRLFPADRTLQGKANREMWHMDSYHLKHEVFPKQNPSNSPLINVTDHYFLSCSCSCYSRHRVISMATASQPPQALS